MQSDQPASPDYNFIMNNAPKKKGLFAIGSKPKRLLMVVAGVGLLIVVFGLIFSFIFGSDSGNTDKLVSLAAEQTEIIRIAEIGEKQASTTDVKNFAGTVSISFTSAQEQLVNYLEKQGHKVQSKELSASKNTQTDTALTAAAQANRFDEVFSTTLQDAVTAYQTKLRQLYQDASSNKQKQTLQAIYNQTATLTTN
jgi:hypothetical protein